MRNIIKRIITVIVSGIMFLSFLGLYLWLGDGRNIKLTAEAGKANKSIVFADSFTNNQPRKEWSWEVGNAKSAPVFKNDAAFLSGTTAQADTIHLNQQLPAKAGLTFTFHIQQNAGTENGVGLIFSTDTAKTEFYTLEFVANRIIMRHNNTLDLMKRKVDELDIQQVHTIRIEMDGLSMNLWLDGNSEPLFEYNGTFEEESLAEARYVTITSTARNAAIDNVLVYEPESAVPVKALEVAGQDNVVTVKGKNGTLQMLSFVSPTEPTDIAVHWETDNPLVATIDQNGVLSAHSTGKVNVMAVTRDGTNLTATQTIIVESAETGQEVQVGGKIKPMAQDYSIMYESPDPDTVYVTGSSVLALGDGRLIGICELGGSGVAALAGGSDYLGKIFVSEDGGKTWKHKHDGKFKLAQIFEAGGKIYVLGVSSDIAVFSSEDKGETWKESGKWKTGGDWRSAPANILVEERTISFVMCRYASKSKTAGDKGLAPIMFKADLSADLTAQKNWMISSAMTFESILTDAFKEGVMNYTGIPFLNLKDAVGWSDANITKITDPDNIWYDPSGSTYQVLLRGGTAGNEFAAHLKFTESGGTLTPSVVIMPSNKKALFVPMSGGNNKFQIQYDSETQLYWMISNQVTDTLKKPEGEQNRMMIQYSKNLIDWVFAGMVTMGDSEKEIRTPAGFVIDGDDLVIMSRSGDGKNKNSQTGNLVTVHRITDFRNLTYY